MHINLTRQCALNGLTSKVKLFSVQSATKWYFDEVSGCTKYYQNSQCNWENYEMLIRILHYLLNRSLTYIVDCGYSGNLFRNSRKLSESIILHGFEITCFWGSLVFEGHLFLKVDCFWESLVSEGHLFLRVACFCWSLIILGKDGSNWFSSHLVFEGHLFLRVA